MASITLFWASMSSQKSTFQCCCKISSTASAVSAPSRSRGFGRQWVLFKKRFDHAIVGRRILTAHQSFRDVIVLPGDDPVADLDDPFQIGYIGHPPGAEIIDGLLDQFGKLFVKDRVLIHLFGDDPFGGMGNGIGLGRRGLGTVHPLAPL